MNHATSPKITPAARQVLYPWIRVELLIRTLNGRRRDPEIASLMKEQLRYYYALRALARRARGWN